MLGKRDAGTPPYGAEHVTIAVSGGRGGDTADVRAPAAQGVESAGWTGSFVDGVLRFAPGLGGEHRPR